MELSGKVKITIEADDKDSNYCSRECLYFINDNYCDLPSITGGSDYCHKYDYVKQKHLRTDTCKMLTSGELEEKEL